MSTCAVASDASFPVMAVGCVPFQGGCPGMQVLGTTNDRLCRAAPPGGRLRTVARLQPRSAVEAVLLSRFRGRGLSVGEFGPGSGVRNRPVSCGGLAEHAHCGIRRLKIVSRLLRCHAVARIFAAMQPVGWKRPVRAMIINCVPWVEMAVEVHSVAVCASF